MKISFSPSIYEHAAFLIKRTPYEVSRNIDLLIQSHCKAYEIYHHSPIVVGIDIYNLEAEAYGCIVEKPSGYGIPAIKRNILSSIGDAISLKPFDPDDGGRISMVIEAGSLIAERFPEADIRIPVSGPFSIAMNLRGLTGILEDISDAPGNVSDFLKQLVDGQVIFCEAIVKAGLDVAFFESAAAPPLLSPGHFHAIEFPALKDAMEKIGKVAGHPIPCIIGGDTEPILDDILNTGTGFIICPAETDQEKFMKKFGNRQDVKVRINMKPAIVAHGSEKDIIAEIDRIISLADGKPNILLGTGAVPYETPYENILLIKDYAES